MKILIENTVPLNNGDAALIFSVGDEYMKRGHDVYYSTIQYELAKKLYPTKQWIKSPLSYRSIKIPILGYLLLVILMVFNRKLRNFDSVISAPGGYVNSYYSLNRKLQLMSLYKKLNNQKIYMYSQSIGPLNKEDEKLIKKYFPEYRYVYARDQISKKRLNDLNLKDNVIQTKDAAFLLNCLITKKTRENTVAISVREWEYDGRSEELYIELIQKITYYFHNKGYKIVFLSTCQGIKSYKDDSLLAKKIFDTLPLELQNDIYVDNNYYNIYQLRKELSKFKYTVGTRLHMCILSWLSGTPAFNISYEEKGKESYDYLGLEDYTVDYNFIGNIEEKLDGFIKMNTEAVFSKIEEIHAESVKDFNRIYKDIA